MERVTKNLNGKLRGHFLEALGALGKSKRRSEAIAIIQPLLNSQKSEDVSAALFAWYDLEMPDWKAQCEAHINSPDANVRLAVRKVMEANERRSARASKAT